MNLGLRWDTWFANYTRNPGQDSNYDVTTNTILIAGVGGNSKSAGIETQFGNISPRLSIAYQLDHKTVIRTGFGRSYFQEIFGVTFNYTTFGYPSLITQQVQPVNPFTPVFTLAQGPPPVVFPEIPESGRLQLPDGISQSYRPNDLSFSYVDSWNFSIERLVAPNTTATVSYVGNVGKNLRQGIPLNQAIPGPGTSIRASPCLTSSDLRKASRILPRRGAITTTPCRQSWTSGSPLECHSWPATHGRRPSKIRRGFW